MISQFLRAKLKGTPHTHEIIAHSLVSHPLQVFEYDYRYYGSICSVEMCMLAG